jgi:lysophospholipase L1-like esterase
MVLMVVVPLLMAGRWIYARLTRPKTDQATARYGKAVAPTSESEAVLRETWSRPYIYEPFVQFSERPFAGRFVNVHQAGFRRGVDQGPWPPVRGNFNIFVFGGSTTFGYGVRDEQTVPSLLQQRLGASTPGRPVRVYNFGRGHYYLTQERILYERMLVNGVVPDLAVFVDGVNDLHYFEDAPEKTPQLVRMFENGYMKWRHENEAWASDLPAYLAPPRERVPLVDETARRAAAARVLERYQRSLKAIDTLSSAFGTRARYAWHPCPQWGYDPRLHAFSSPQIDPRLIEYGYETMNRRRAEIPGLIWCADVHRSARTPLYVDALHFGPELSRMVADCIADGLGRGGP